MKANAEIAQRVVEFAAVVQTEINKEYAKKYSMLTPPTVRIDEGSKNFKVVLIGSQTSVHCFVSKTDGKIYKAATWKAPAKHARGSIFDANFGWGTAVNVYGGTYLR